MLKPLCHFCLTLFAGIPIAISAQEPATASQIAITKEPTAAKPTALSKGYILKRLSFDASAKVEGEEQKSGVEFSSYKPGNIWSGEIPSFFPKTFMVAGEDKFPITDVTSYGLYLFGFYGMDHYQTRVVSVVDANRRSLFEFTANGLSNFASCALEDGILYYTTVESNINEKHNARLHAFSIGEKKQLWQTDSGSAHGNFILRKNHILTHFGFTAEDDFLCVIDRGSGKVLKKEKLKTAANCLIEEEDGTITVPAYTGVYRYAFSEMGNE